MILEFICTDRGRHAKANLGYYTPADDTTQGVASFVRTRRTKEERLASRLTLDAAREGRLPLDERARSIARFEATRMDVTCPRCRRNPRYSAERLEAMSQSAARFALPREDKCCPGMHDHVEVDVSLLGDC